MNDKINQYFENKGVDVCFNTLGANEELVNSYISTFQNIVNDSHTKKSQNIKFDCYNKLYTLELRPKFTGFEKVTKEDNNFRREINEFITESQFAESHVKEKFSDKNTPLSYKETLKKFIKNNFKNPLLYLSGGIDSELLATAFVDTGTAFTPVIFEWYNNKGQLLNDHDICYAYKFCKRYFLLPVIKKINIEKLWKSQEFKKLAIDLQIPSPQLVTYAYAVFLINEAFPNRTHLFGGEIRFSTDYLLDDNRTANLVSLIKLNPGFSGKSYQVYVRDGGGPAQLNVIFNSNGTWQINANGTSGSTILYGTDNPGGTASGTWTDTPGSSYEFRQVTGGYGSTTGGPGYILNVQSPSTMPTQSPQPEAGWPAYVWPPTAWKPISGATILYQQWTSGRAPGLPGIYIGSASCDFEIRVIGQTSPVLSFFISTATITD